MKRMHPNHESSKLKATEYTRENVNKPLLFTDQAGWRGMRRRPLSASGGGEGVPPNQTSSHSFPERGQLRPSTVLIPICTLGWKDHNKAENSGFSNPRIPWHTGECLSSKVCWTRDSGMDITKTLAQFLIFFITIKDLKLHNHFRKLHSTAMWSTVSHLLFVL